MMTKFKDKLSSSPDTSYLPSHSTSTPLSYLHKVGSAMSCNSNRSAKLAMIAGGDDSNFLVSRTCVRSCGNHVGWRCGLQDEVELVPAHVHVSVSGCELDVARQVFFSSVCSLFLLSCHQTCPVYCHLPTIRASKVCPLGAREPGVRTHLKIVRTCTEGAGTHKKRQTRIWQSSKNKMAWQAK